MTSIPSINDSKRLVIKVGSSLLLKKNEFHFNWLDSLIDDIIFLRKKKIELVLVISGAVSLGKKYLNFTNKVLKLNTKQACAACGQVILMKNFLSSFKKKKIKSSANSSYLFGYRRSEKKSKFKGDY